MFKKLNMLMLAILLLGQTVLGPMAVIAETVEPVAEEQSENTGAQSAQLNGESDDAEATKEIPVESENTDEGPVNETEEEQRSESQEEKSLAGDAATEQEQPQEVVQEEAAPEDESVEEETEADIQSTEEELEDVAEPQEVSNEHFSLGISEVKDFDGNVYGPDNPLKPNDEFWLRMDWTLENGHKYQGGDTTTFQLPKELQLNDTFDGELKDEFGDVVATYVITPDGEVTLTFTDFVETSSNVKGWLEIRAQLDLDEVEEEDGKIVIGPIGEEGNQEIPIDRTPINKTVEKQGTPNKSYNADEIEWTVTINKSANSLKDVSLEDLLPAGTVYKEGSIKAVKQGATLSGKPVGDPVDVVVTASVQDGKLTIPLGDIEEVYTITYVTTVTDMDQKSFKNNIVFKDGELADTSADATVTINRGEPLKKGAVKNYDPKTGIIEWYLEFNYNQKQLDGVTLADNWTPADKVGLVDGSVSFQEVTIDENGKAVPVGSPVDVPEGATFSKKDGGFEISNITTDKAYYVVYQTKVTDRQLEGFRMENLATFGDHEAGNGYNIGQYVGVKSAGAIDYQNKTIEWTIKVNTDHRQMNDVIITDTLGEGLTLIKDSIVMKIGGNAKTDFSLEEGNPFKLTNIGDTNQEIIVTYKTKFDADKVPNHKPTNTANISWIPENGDRINMDVSAGTELNKETKDSSWKNGSYNPDTKEITWTVIANYRENTIEDLNIIDSPQGNQKLIKDSIVVEELKVAPNGSYTVVGDANAIITTENNDINVQIGQTNKAYKMTYKTSVAGLTDLSKEYKNKAAVKDGNETLSNLEAKVGVYGDRKYGNKRGQQDGRQVHWSIDVNLAQEKISNLVLEDIISDNQAYLEDTIKVYHAKVTAGGKATKGDLVSSNEYDLVIDETNFTVKWKDDVERAFIVEYSTLFFAKDGEGVRNEYKISGDGISEDDKSTSDGYSVTIRQTSAGGAEGSSGYLLLQKVDTTYGQAKQPISDVTFELIDTTNGKVLKTITTDSKGYANFGRLLFGTYELKEVNVPAGYVQPEEQVIITIDKKFDQASSDPLDYVLEVENYKANHSVELLKRDDAGKRLAGAEFTLFTADGQEVSTATTDAAGEIKFLDLAVGNYYVQETKAPAGFDLDDKKHVIEITEKQHKPVQIEAINEFIKTSVTLEKVWKDDDAETAKRPSFVTVNLFQNDMYYGTYEIKEEDGWKLTIDDLHAIDPNGEDYVYTMTEHGVHGYAPTFDSTTVTNTRTGERDITITKTWFDDQSADRPEVIEVELTRQTFEFIVGKGYVPKGDVETVSIYELSEQDNWTLTLEKLPVFDGDGLPYSYELAEINVPTGYETSTQGPDITNTRVGKTAVSGNKIWKDNNAPDRPTSVEIELLKDGDVVESQIVSADTNWEYSFENLEQYDAQGVAYQYTISEKPVFAYDVEYVSTVEGFDVINTRVGQTGISGTKTWVDGDGEDRPQSITVKLLQNGKELTEQNVTAASDWKYEFTSLPAYDSEGNPYVYTIEEAAVEGYATTVSGYNLTNIRVGETSVEGTKTWKDDNDENRPTSITVNLLQNGVVVDTQDVTAATDWAFGFDQLAKYDAQGAAYNYTIEEVSVDGYTSTVDGFDITNVRVGETSVEGTKTWKDDNDENRPGSITVNLLQNGTAIDSIEVTSATNWAFNFDQLAEFDEQGVAYDYTIEEVAVDGYTSTVDGFNITNIRVGETSVEGTKTWKDDSESDRPISIKVNLLQNGAVIDSTEVTAATNWAFNFDQLAAFDEEGVAYEYTISEVDVPGYNAEVDGFDITNTRTDIKAIEITKAWLDEDAKERPEAITVELFRSIADGEKEAVDTVKVTAENDWKLVIEDLPAFDQDGKAYLYEIEEQAVKGYESTVNGFNITNVRVGETSVEGTKIWKDDNDENRPASITVNLLQNGTVIDTQAVTAATDWAFTFDQLAEFDEQGITYAYTISEEAVDGYEVKIDGFDLTNVRVGETSVEGTKTWKDDNDENRPTSITVNLLQNGAVIDSTEVTAATNWAFGFDQLTKYDAQGVAYNYAIEEVAVDGYTSTVDGFDITNVRVGETSVEGTKTWKDDNDENRPASITVNLLQNGTAIDSIEVTAATDWAFNFDQLAEFDEQGVAYDYTIEEVAVDGYTSTVDGFNITNIRVGETSVEGTKTWKDDSESDRPASITVNLLQNGAVIDSTEVTAATNWAFTFDQLAAFDEEGVAYAYTISEVDVPGYNVEVDGFDITNTRTEEKTIELTKAWLDEGITDRPETITVELFRSIANGEKEAVDTYEVTAENDWKLVIEDLPAFNQDGKAYLYEIEEQAVKGYESTVNGFNITNVRVGETSVEGTKTWKDGHAEDRPASITVNLLQNGAVIDSTEVTAATDWTFSFDELAKFDEQGIAYVYTISEEAVDGYKVKIDGFDLTNVRVGETSVEGTKTWKDDNENDRPASITVNLLQNGVVVDTKEVTAATDWIFSFDQLAKFDEEGVAYDYTISEVDVPGYNAEINGFDITNTRTAEKSIELTKAWLDDNAKNRPEAITVELFRSIENGEKEAVDTVKVTVENDWKLVIENLPAFNQDGKAYTYEIAEQVVKGYESIVNGFNITNVRVGETSVEGTKTWKGDSEKNRPASITVNLYQNGKVIDTKEVTAETNWAYAFENLYAYDAKGKAYNYTVGEVEVKGYKVTYDGFNITNTWIVEENPETPGKEDPEEPGKEEPETPGKEDPEEPGKEEPETPGKEDPEEPGKEEPETPGKEDPKEPGKDKDKPGGNLPQTATNTFTMIFVGLMLALVGAALYVVRAKRVS